MKSLPPSGQSPRSALLGVVLLACFIGFFQAVSLAQSSATGTIAGQVTHEVTRSALAGAAVSLQSDPRIRAFTEMDGSFRLEGVPTGSQTVVVDYTGLDQGMARVAVTAGAATTVAVKLNAGIYLLNKFEVSSVREGQAAATAASARRTISRPAWRPTRSATWPTATSAICSSICRASVASAMRVMSLRSPSGVCRRA